VTVYPGKLRERITVQQPVREQNELGETTLRWIDYQRIWASVEGVKSSEVLGNGQQLFDVTHRVRLRYFKWLNNNMRFDWHGRTLEIVSLLEHGHRTELEAICREVQR